MISSVVSSVRLVVTFNPVQLVQLISIFTNLVTDLEVTQNF
jgi:hypothetical protein